MVRLNPKMLSVALTIPLLVSLGCNSRLKVLSKTKSVESSGTESTEPNATPDSEGGVQDPDSKNNGTGDSQGLTLRILADDGNYYQQDVILKSKQLSASWEDHSNVESTKLVIALDQGCDDPLFTFENNANNSRSLSFLEDGVYFLCLFGKSSNSDNVAAINNGLKLTLDREPPQIIGDTSYFFNQAAATTMTIKDTTPTTYQWTLLTGPGPITISDPKVLNPTFSTGINGVFNYSLALADAAGNSTVAKIIVTWDTFSPILTSIDFSGVAMDGFVNGAEVAGNTPMVTVQAAGFDVIGYTTPIPDSGSVVCDASQPYTQTQSPLVSDLTGPDGSYIICVKLADLAGNVTYGSTGSIVKDTTPPTITSFVLNAEAADGRVSQADISSGNPVASISVSGAQTTSYSGYLVNVPTVICNDSRTYDQPSIPIISGLPTVDTDYVVCAQSMDEAGNIAYASSPAIMVDLAPPVFISMSGANQAGDGFINSSEITSSSPLVTLSASQYTVASYTSVLMAAGLVCDVSQTYSLSSIPAINSIPAGDNDYAVCVKLEDLSGNISYGKSQTITRDTVAPILTFSSGINAANDGYINASEYLSPAAMVGLNASGYTEVKYSSPLTSTATCDGLQTYHLTAAPAISDLPASDGLYAVCILLTDAAGNTTFAKSDTLTRDIVAPTISSFTAANEALDGYVNSAEASSALAIAALVAGGYTVDDYSAIMDDSTPFTCDGSQTYGNADIPAISSIPAVDGSYALCVKLSDAAGNSAYGKSSVVIRDVTAPIFTSLALANGASDAFINATESSSTAAVAILSGSGYSADDFTALLDDSTPITCDASKTYGNAVIPAINSLSSDGVYALCVKLTDAAGNITYGKSPAVTRDVSGPTFTSLVGANGASDSFVNSSEYLSTAAMLTLNASDYVIEDYTAPMSSTAACDGSQIYSNPDIPAISDLPGSDGNYVVCVRLSDAAGNPTYGQSSVITRDITPPIFTVLALANGAADGFVNIAESSSTDAIATLTASGYDTASYSNLLDNSGSIACDGSQTYANSSIPAINTLAADGVYALCVKLLDTAGNISYGKSPQVTRDSSGPIFSSLTGANEASDGYINATEIGSTAELFSLTASEYTSALYTSVLASTMTCDDTQTYGSGSIPAINSLTASDGSYAVCVQLSDASGNFTFGKSQAIVRDVTAPIITSFVLANGAGDGLINSSESTSASAFADLTASGSSSFNYSAILNDSTGVTCDDGQSYGNSSIPAINTLSTDGMYALCAKLVDTAGNIAYGKSPQAIRDTIMPTITSLLATNEAIDGYINNSESSSTASAWSLIASGYTAVSYTQPLSDNGGAISCDISQTYNQSSIATISSITTDDAWVICARLLDDAGNTTYGKSAVINRDILPPTMTSFNGANEASDGYINNAEKSSALPLFTLVASDYSVAHFTSPLNDTTPITCNVGKTYSLSSIPAINSIIPTSETYYAACVRLADAAGNIFYGKSQRIAKDIDAPDFNFTNAIGSVNISNAGSNSWIYSITSRGGSGTDGVVTEEFTMPLIDAANVTCDDTLTYPFTDLSLFDGPNFPKVSHMGADGSYTVCGRRTDSAGNKFYRKGAAVIKDTVAPTFVSMTLANEAADGFISASELTSSNPIVTLDASDYSTAVYTLPKDDTPAITCNGTQTYDQANPQINQIPNTDDSYAICVRLTDSVGNISYGKSPQLTRDTTPPLVTSFIGTNEAVDGYINNAESSSALAFAALTASGQSTANFTAILVDSPVTCDGAQTYGNSSIPAISTMGADNTYALCVQLSDAAGNITYGKSTSVIKDTVTPTVDAGVDILTNVQVTSSATASGASTYSWVKTTGTGTITFGTASALNTTISSSADGPYTLTLTATDAAGNSASDVLNFTWDTAGPVFTSLLGNNDASDGYINANETASALPLLILSASGHDTAAYTAILDDSTPITCDASKTYGGSTIPLINTMPALDAPYAVCVKLSDNAGNIIYGKSQIIARDTVSPLLTSFTLTNGAADGYISSSEASSGLGFASASGTGQTTTNYSVIFDDATPVTCDGGRSYPYPSPPNISSILAANGTFAVCGKLTDAAGNITYGKSPVATKDTVAPIFTSLLGANGASDGYVNGSEYLSGSAMLTLNASGYTSANYTSALLDSSLTCDDSKTYINNVIQSINTIPGIDGNYAVCVKLSDAAGNITYGKSQTLVRDITAPIFTSLVASNDASDGYINSTESSSALAFATLTASGQTTTAYTALLVDSPTTCDGLQTYGNSSIPAINTLGADNTYALCVKLADDAGNITYGKSTSVVKDTVAPTVDAGSDILTNVQVSSSANASGASTFSWVKTTGTGTITFGSATSLNTTISASADEAYTLTLTATDASGNTASDVLTFTWDTTGPVFTSLHGVNAASDGYVNASEYLSPAALFGLSASDYTTTAYSLLLDDTAGVAVCNAGQTYGLSSIPAISDLSSDGAWAVCVKLTDTAGNTTYGKSQQIIRDIVIPSVDVGSDQSANAQISLTPTVAGATSFQWSKSFGGGPITFGTPTTANTTVSASADGTYTLTLLAADDAGNTVGDSLQLVWDTVLPLVPSLNIASQTFHYAFDVTVSQNGTSDSNFKEFRYTLTGVAPANCSDGTATSGTINIGGTSTVILNVIACDTAGNASPAASATYTYTDLPGQPIMQAFTDVLSTSVTINWSNVSLETGFKVERAAYTTSCGSYSQIGTVGADILTFGDNSLSASTTYCYRVRAYNAGGDGSYAIESTITTVTLPPSAPTIQSASNHTTSSYRISWTNVANETSYEVERAPYSGTCGTYANYATPSADQLSIDETSMMQGIVYCYRVRAVNDGGSSSYSASTLGSPKPSPPTGIVVTPVATGFYASWDALSGTGYSYNINYSWNSGASGGSVSPGTTSYTVLAGDPNYEMTVKIRSYIAGVFSDYSANYYVTPYIDVVAAPTFTPSPAGVYQTYTSAQSVTLATSTSGASIQYHKGGATYDPSSWAAYSGAISVNSTSTIWAQGIKTNWEPSAVVHKTYVIEKPWQRQQFIPGIESKRALHVFSGSNVWIGGTAGTIMNSTDSGATWSQIPLNMTAEVSAMHFPTASVGYATLYMNGLYKTTDSGVTWNKVTTIPNNYADGDVYFISATTGWVSGGSYISKTTDGGSTWNSVYVTGLDTDGIAKLHFRDANIGFITGSDGFGKLTIKKTADGGATWSSTTVPATLNFSYGLAQASSTTFLAARTSGAILRSTDTGANWSSVTVSGASSIFDVTCSSTDCWAAASGGEIFKSTDSGATWTQQTSPTSGDLYRVRFADANNGWIVGYWGALLKTTNGGTTWTKATQGIGYDLYDIAEVPNDWGNSAYTVGYWGTILKTTNGGTSWSQQTSCSASTLRRMCISNDGIKGWAVGDSGTICRTINSGGTWTAQAGGAGTLNGVACDPSNPDNGWIVGNSGLIRRTTAGGSPWDTVTSPTSQHLYDIKYNSYSNTLWAVGGTGTILKSTDAGVNWTTVTSGTTAFLYDIAWGSDKVGMIGTSSNNMVLITIDGGNTWAQNTGINNVDIQPLPISAVYASGPTGFWVGAGYGSLYYTPDAGTTWIREYTTQFGTIYGLSGNYAVGLGGSVIKKP